MDSKEKLIEEMFEKGMLVSKDMLDKKVDNTMISKLDGERDMLVLDSNSADIVAQQTSLVDWYEIDKLKVEAERDRNDDLYQSQLQKSPQSTIQVNLSSSESASTVSIKSSSLEVELFSDPETFNSTNFSSVNNSLTETQLSSSLSSHLSSTISLSSALNPLSSTPINSLNTSLILEYPLNIIVSYDNQPHKYGVKDFANIFVSRFKFMERILRNRQEIVGTLTSISRILSKKERETVSVIGLIENISITKNGNIILTLEDLTGKISVLISKNNSELFVAGKELVHDEVVGISGMNGDKIIFADKIIWPDIPTNNELKCGPEDIYAVFLSDIHVGSKMFLREEFERFLNWICGNTGNEAQREAAAKVKYIFIAGDLVDGVGIYPAQEAELDLKDIREQYTAFCNLISRIPKDKHLIMCPGNHDVVHLAEPQPLFYKDYAPELYTLPNVTLVTNPAIVNIAKTKDFPGFDVLMYHGYSFDYYVNNVEYLRNGGGYHRADLIMKFLLKRRHLAPSFKSTPYFPGHAEDPLIIKKIPDFFISGHIHYSKVANYKGITLISGSCWQSITAFQQKVGHDPEPARVPLINLRTREVKILKFIGE